jgi:cyanate lyase
MSYSQTSRADLTSAIIDAKDRLDLSWQDLADSTTLSVAFVTAALLGQHPLPTEAAASISEKLDLGEDAARVLESIPTRGCIPDKVPTDPTIYRFYEILQVYGTTLKALIHEQFGDGIISAVNVKLDIKKVDDPDGGSRAIITLDGKFLPYAPF